MKNSIIKSIDIPTPQQGGQFWSFNDKDTGKQITKEKRVVSFENNDKIIIYMPLDHKVGDQLDYEINEKHKFADAYLGKIVKEKTNNFNNYNQSQFKKAGRVADEIRQESIELQNCLTNATNIVVNLYSLLKLRNEDEIIDKVTETQKTLFHNMQNLKK
tara:strand:+ start:387 stop:863 length:477 start_codon:yes stop_codon:yes gene_type:complete